MNFKRQAVRALGAFVFLAIAFVTGVAFWSTNRGLDYAHIGDYELMRDVFAAKLDAFQDEALEEAELVASIPAIRRAFLAKDRPRLVEELGSMFAVQAQKYGVDQAQFHEPGGISFLRLHQPEKFGDEQASYRPMLADAHREQAAREGIEITRKGPVVSGIVPVLDDAKKFAGTFEMALDLDPLFDELKRDYELEGALFVDDQTMRRVATDVPAEQLDAGKDVGPFFRYHTTHDELLASLLAGQDVDITEPRSFEREVDGKTWGVQLIPIFNQAHRRIGLAALANNFGEDRTMALRSMVWQGLAGVFAVVLALGALLIVIRGWLLAPLAQLNQNMSALLEGEAAPPLARPEVYCEELRRYAELYEELRRREQS